MNEEIQFAEGTTAAAWEEYQRDKGVAFVSGERWIEALNRLKQLRETERINAEVEKRLMERAAQ